MISIFQKLQEKPVIKYIDQLVSALISYVLLMPSFFEYNYIEIAKISVLTSIFTFWLGLIRITVIIEVLDKRNLNLELSSFFLKTFLYCCPSLVIIGISEHLDISKESSITLALIIFFGIFEELFRQKFLAQKRYFFALILDGTWLLITLALIITNNGNYEMELRFWLIGAMSSFALGVFINRKNMFVRNLKKKKIVKNTALLVPMFLSSNTFIQNYLIYQMDSGKSLGLYRGLQLFFLPAIFIINLQQVNLIPLISDGLKVQIEVHRKRLLGLISFLVVLAFVASHFYLKYHSIDVAISTVVILICFSVFINFEINFRTLVEIANGFENRIVIMRSLWLVLTALSLYLFANSLLTAVFIFTVIDLIMLVNLISPIYKKIYRYSQKRLMFDSEEIYE